VAFLSDAANLVAGDTNGATDVFVHGLQTGVTTRVSTAMTGAEADSGSNDWDVPAVSADGAFVAFASGASNLVPGVANGQSHIYVREIKTGAMVCASVDPGGLPGNGNSFAPSLSADGRIVAFSSYASNLAAGDTDALVDVFVRNLETGQTTRVSVAPDGSAADGDSGCASLSGNGLCVAFPSNASNLVASDTNDTTDIFVRDLQAGVTTLVSVASDGSLGNGWSDYTPAISQDGSVVVFLSDASNLADLDTNEAPDVFVHDRRTGATARASVASTGAEANDASYSPSVSASGRYVTYASNASNLASGDTNGAADVFVRDMLLSKTALVSIGTDAAPGNGASGPFYPPAISADGRTVAFQSWASGLVAGDTNGAADVFARTPLFVTPAISLMDVQSALRAIGGLEALTAAQMTLWNTERSGASADVLDILDAIRLARIAAGLD
jgi:Tol biopolymer transport system component